MMPHPSQRKRANSGANAAQMDLIDLIEQMERQDANADALRTASTPSTELQRQALAASERRAGHPPVRFRHPATGETWTGRGLKPRWVIDAIAGGMTLEQLAVQA